MLFKVENNQVVDQGKLGVYLESLKNGRYRIEREKSQRSVDQNRLLWGYYKLIGKQYGENDIEYIHEMLKMKFLTMRDKKAPYVKSTARLSKEEFSEYIENIKNMFAEMGFILPDADERHEGIEVG